MNSTPNNYNVMRDTTPFDALVNESGIGREELDKACHDLTRRGNNAAAEQVRQGTLPPLEAFAPGPLQDSLRDHYIRLAKQTAEVRGITQLDLENAVASLYASDPIVASKVLLNQGNLEIEVEVERAHRDAQKRAFATAFDGPEQIGHLAHVYLAAARLPPKKCDAVRKVIDNAAINKHNSRELQLARNKARHVSAAEHVKHLILAYADARGKQGDSTAVTELGRIAANASVHELRADADRLIREGGKQAAYDTLETRFQDQELAAIPEPLQQAMRVAIVGELGRINALHVLATDEMATFDGDATADAKLLSEHQLDLMAFLSASIQTHGVRKTLLNVTAAIQQYADGSERRALHVALDQAWKKLPDDIAFKHAERLNGTRVHLQELGAAQKQIREQYGNECPIAQAIGRLIEHVDKNTT